MTIEQADDLNFEEEVIKAEMPALVCFTSSIWLPRMRGQAASRRFAPALDEVAEQLAGTANVLEFDLARIGEGGTRYGIGMKSRLPILVLFSNGVEVCAA